MRGRSAVEAERIWKFKEQATFRSAMDRGSRKAGYLKRFLAGNGTPVGKQLLNGLPVMIGSECASPIRCEPKKRMELRVSLVCDVPNLPLLCPNLFVTLCRQTGFAVRASQLESMPAFAWTGRYVMDRLWALEMIQTTIQPGGCPSALDILHDSEASLLPDELLELDIVNCGRGGLRRNVRVSGPLPPVPHQ
jgi:hypothetical protein